MITSMAKAMTDFESEHVDIVDVRDLAEARRFYEEVLGCLKGPGDEQCLDFNLYGHQIVCRLNPQLGKEGRVDSHYHLMQGKYVPVSRCRVVLEMRKWRSIVRRLKQHRVKFVMETYRHFRNTAGGQATCSRSNHSAIVPQNSRDVNDRGRLRSGFPGLS